MSENFKPKPETSKEKPKLHGTFVNEIAGLAARLAMKKNPQKLRKYLEREDIQKKHSQEEIQELTKEIEGFDERVEQVNILIEKYNSAEDENKEEIKKEILEKCNEIIDLLYGDDPRKEMVKRSIR